MSEVTDPLAWITRAEEDYALARSALRRKSPLTYGACFHAQQCAEKYLKAVLVARGQRFPKTHDLGALTDLCIRVGVMLTVNEDRLDTLSSYAVEARYPGQAPSPDVARQALETAKLVRSLVRRLLQE